MAGRILAISKLGHPALRHTARALSLKDMGSRAFRSLVADLNATLDDSGGLGLAAPQVRVNERVVVVHIPEGVGLATPVPRTVLVNPVITPVGGETSSQWESCLSVRRCEVAWNMPP